ncbi:MAG: hypothetical protein JXR95_12520 [Deltaproteobacteria bacterium]|nr:hypothetical protein [Deltaproteobacteria bacterium]
MLDLIQVKCDSCGTINEVIPGSSIIECDSCGSLLRVPEMGKSKDDDSFEFGMNFQSSSGTSAGLGFTSSSDNEAGLGFTSSSDNEAGLGFTSSSDNEAGLGFASSSDNETGLGFTSSSDNETGLGFASSSDSGAEQVFSSTQGQDNNDTDFSSSNIEADEHDVSSRQDVWQPQSEEYISSIDQYITADELVEEEGDDNYSRPQYSGNSHHLNSLEIEKVTEPGFIGAPPKASSGLGPLPPAPAVTQSRVPEKKTANSQLILVTMMIFIGIIFSVFIKNNKKRSASRRHSKHRIEKNSYRKKQRLQYPKTTSRNKAVVPKDVPNVNSSLKTSWLQYRKSEGILLHPDMVNALDKFVATVKPPVIHDGRGVNIFIFHPYTHIGVARLRQLSKYRSKIISKYPGKIRWIEVPHSGENKADYLVVNALYSVWKIGGASFYESFKLGLLNTIEWRLKGREIKTIMEIAKNSNIDDKVLSKMIKSRSELWRIKSANQYVKNLKASQKDFSLVVGNFIYPSKAIYRIDFIVDGQILWGNSK